MLIKDVHTAAKTVAKIDMVYKSVYNSPLQFVKYPLSSERIIESQMFLKWDFAYKVFDL